MAHLSALSTTAAPADASALQHPEAALEKSQAECVRRACDEVARSSIVCTFGEL